MVPVAAAIRRAFPGASVVVTRRAAQWHALAVAFVGASLGFPPPPGPSAGALARPRRAVL
jgi:hypothetical protein